MGHRGRHQHRDGTAAAQRNARKPWLTRQWVMAPAQHAACVDAMEEVVEVSPRPHDPPRPVGCWEASRQPLVQDTRPPLPAAAGRPATTGSEEERNGTAHRGMLVEPLGGPRWGVVTERRPARDDAHAVQHGVDESSPHAEQSVLGQEHLTPPPLLRSPRRFPRRKPVV